jgi:hypothetical protein
MGRLDNLVAVTVPEAPELVTPGDLGDELASFTRAMRATIVSPNTISAYGGAVRQFGRWLMEHEYPTKVFTIDPDSNQPVQVNRQRYMREGRIITSPQGGFVDIATPGRGPGFTVGPGMTIEVKDGKARIIEYDPSGWSTRKTHEFFMRTMRRNGCPDLKDLRTNSAVLEARG